MSTFASHISEILLACELDVLFDIYDRIVAKKSLKDTSKILSDSVEYHLLSKNRVRQDYEQRI